MTYSPRFFGGEYVIPYKNRLDKAVAKGSKRRPGVRQTVVKGGKKLEITLVQAA